MMKNALPLIAALAVTWVAQAAETDSETPRLKALEQAIEATSATVRLPDRAPAAFFARTCETCPTVTLQVTQTTRFFLGKTAVPQNEFNAAVQTADPDPTLGIFYDSKTSEVTRLVAFGINTKPAANTKSRRGK
jgi:formylglycine-generating enzyme required for sulfatase activity